MVQINNIRAKIYIPSLDIEHPMYIIHPKLVTATSKNKITAVKSTENPNQHQEITVNSTTFKLYQKILVSITKLPSKERFNDKLFISIAEPKIDIY